MQVGLLGGIRAQGDDGAPIEVGGVRLRMLLARLALDAGRVVSVDALVDGLWGAEPLADAGNAVQTLVSRLRKVLRPADVSVDLVGGGYRLGMRAEDVDAHRFEELAARGRRELAADRPDEAASVLAEALALWRGPALADLAEAPFARAVATRLDGLRVDAAEDRFEAELRLGRHAEALADLEAACAAHPLRERTAAMRMRALYAVGRQADALAGYEDIRGRLAAELGVDPSAELRETHLAVLRGELDRPVARSEAAAPPLPARLTGFFGRDDELRLLAVLMAGSRLVTLVGAGGAGKTRLSVEAVTRHQAYRRGRVWFVPLAGVGTPEGVADAVLSALGSWDLRSSDGRPRRTGTALDRVAELLDVGAAVLILDNCEHLVDAAAELTYRLLDRLSQLTVVATSREPLGITGEALCRVGPLPVPTSVGDPDADLAAAAEAASVRLFLDRAGAVRPGFALDAGTIGPVVEICRRLDGMPLALELAAARLRAMSVEQIARRLDDRFRLLGSGSRAEPPRRRTLHAVVEWSWDLLAEPEQLLARRLSVFPGGATVAALEAVCADELLPVEDVFYVLGSLVEKSIVDAVGDGEPRYRMLETVRAYAAEQLVLAGEQAGFAVRFERYFLALAYEQDPLLRTSAQLDSLALLDAEYDNLMAALRAFVDAGQAADAAGFAGALFWYWGIRGIGAPFETIVPEVLRFGDALPEHARAAFAVMRLLAGIGAPRLADGEELRSLLEACASTDVFAHYPALVVGLPLAAFLSGNTEAGERELARMASGADPWVRACAHWMTDFVHTDRGDWEAGASARAEALAGFAAVGDRWGLGTALMAIGAHHSMRGEHEPAIDAFERAVALAGELGAADDASLYRGTLAAERMRVGDLAGARTELEAADRQAWARGHRYLELAALSGRAELHRRAGEFRAAERMLDRLGSLAESLSLPAEMVGDMLAQGRLATLLTAAEATFEATAKATAEENVDPASTGRTHEIDPVPSAGTDRADPVARARELLPATSAAAVVRRDLADVAPTAELLAAVLRWEGDSVGAAEALGLSAALRGIFDAGSPDLRLLVDRLVATLGTAGYREAYERGAALPREQALGAVLARLEPLSVSNASQ
ncbi:BTAD domain-containing putative transcriptional regulator [Embleya sp. NPDC005575]|uniref:BTAD domain-containing putative transcriptional regulator n=1 Tax=Embleya sp. NPDC005575 TaxID=3156892 RepID=UPI0033AFA00B